MPACPIRIRIFVRRSAEQLSFQCAGTERARRHAQPVQLFRSLAADLRRPLRTVVASLNGGTRGASDRYSRSPSIPSPPEQPPPPRDLSIVDSKELIREILRRVGEDPDREGLQQTPARIVRSWKEIYGGYAQCAEDVLVTQFQAEQYRRNGAAARHRVLLHMRASYAPVPWESAHRLPPE